MANADDRDDPGLRPLTKKQKNGVLLYRSVELVDELTEVLRRPLGGLAARKGELSSSALVYILRNLRPNREEGWYIALWHELAARVGGQASNQASGLPSQHRQDVKQAVVDWLQELVFGSDDRADSLEAFFGRAVQSRTIDEIRKIKRRTGIERNEVEFETADGVPRDLLDAANLRNAGHAMPRAEAAARVAAVLDRLTDRERAAVAAVYVEGLAQKSDDPDEMTAAKKLGVSPRRISELLANARKRTSGDEEAS